eukprot:XP_011411950.1 PREDICTED: uncharacterized protein LOC105317112 [Crassostrea gigas]
MDICENLRPLYRIQHCSRCQGNTEFYCRECCIDLCLICKENHCINLDSKDHEVVNYRNKVIYPSEQAACEIHTEYVDETDAQHETLNILTAFELKKRQHSNILNNIRSDDLYYRHVLLANIRTDLKSRQSRNLCSQIYSRIKTKSLKVKDMIENVVCNDKSRHQCSVQKIKMQSHLARIEENEYLFEQSATKPVTFLWFVKKNASARIHDTLSVKKHGILGLINRTTDKALNDILNAKIEKRKRQTEYKQLLRVMPKVVLKKSFKLNWENLLFHKPCQPLNQTSEHIWLRRDNHLYLTNAKSEKLFQIYDDQPSCCFCIAATHTMTRDKELIYIDRMRTIQKLSGDIKIELPLLIDSFWLPFCVHISPYTENLLVGMSSMKSETSLIMRYNIKDSGPKIKPKIIGRIENWFPSLLTDNINGDIIVAYSYMCRGFQVIDRVGSLRFIYPKTPAGSKLWTEGLCTDPLSHILVSTGPCVFMISKDGQFLSYLLTRPFDAGTTSLLFDHETYLLWVRDLSNTFSVYRYIERYDILTGSEIPFSSCCSEAENGDSNVISHPGDRDPENDGLRLLRQMYKSAPKKRKHYKPHRFRRHPR